MLHVRRHHSWAPCVVRCIARGLLGGGGAKQPRAHAPTNFRAHTVVSRWPVFFFACLPVCLFTKEKKTGWVGTGGPGQPGTVGHCYTVRLRRAWLLRTAAVTATTFSGARPKKIGVLVLLSLKLALKLTLTNLSLQRNSGGTPDLKPPRPPHLLTSHCLHTARSHSHSHSLHARTHALPSVACAVRTAPALHPHYIIPHPHFHPHLPIQPNWINPPRSFFSCPCPGFSLLSSSSTSLTIFLFPFPHPHLISSSLSLHDRNRILRFP